MTTLLGGQDLPRPAATPDAGPLDERLYDLVETRVRRMFTDNPIMATYFGIHSEDHRLGDAGRDAVEHEIDFRYDKRLDATERVERLLQEDAERERPPVDDGESEG